jgi:hypothetical protein
MWVVRESPILPDNRLHRIQIILTLLPQQRTRSRQSRHRWSASVRHGHCPSHRLTCRMVEATRDARLSIPLTQHSNRVSTNTNLCPRETRFCAAETKAPERALEVQLTVCRDKMRARIPASSGLFTSNREISVCLRLRGGAERTRTACQPRSRYRTDLRPGPSGGFSAIKCR